jgi:CubicO group peptidase (beta-lactamase class C family)
MAFTLPSLFRKIGSTVRRLLCRLKVSSQTPARSRRLKSETVASTVRTLLQEAVAKNLIPGAVILAISNNDIVLEESVGFRDRECRDPHHLDDCFFLASASKPIATTVIMSLVQSEVLSLDESLSRLIPALQTTKLISGEPVSSPTLRQMLSHTAGMFGVNTGTPEQHRLLYDFQRPANGFAEQVAGQALIYRPGEEFSYGGASMFVAARASELATGQDFERLLHKILLQPLGMSNTFYRTRARFQDRFSILYQKNGHSFTRCRFQPTAAVGSHIIPAGSIISTARDLATFLQVHLGEGGLEGCRVLAPELAREMRRDHRQGRSQSQPSGRTKPVTREPGLYGLGWSLEEIGGDGVAQVFQHGGLFGTFLWCDMDAQLGVVFLSHLRHPPPEFRSLRNRIVNAIRDGWG